MSPQDLGLLLGVFFVSTLTLGFLMDWYDERRNNDITKEEAS